jgi:hypothetical protein
LTTAKGDWGLASISLICGIIPSSLTILVPRHSSSNRINIGAIPWDKPDSGKTLDGKRKLGIIASLTRPLGGIPLLIGRPAGKERKQKS